MKHKTLLFTLLAATTLTACSTKKNQQPTEPQPAPVEARLMTYNLHNCIGMDNRRDYHRIADAIRQARPDVVALQELDSVTGRNGGIHALDTLRALTGKQKCSFHHSSPINSFMRVCTSLIWSILAAFVPVKNRPFFLSPLAAAQSARVMQ